MRKAIFILAMFIPMVSLAEHHDWEDNHVLQINREPRRQDVVTQRCLEFPLDEDA